MSETPGVDPRIVIHFDEPRRQEHPCERGHHWAWAALVRGGVRRVCRVCGAQ